jgi:hypothetical protein
MSLYSLRTCPRCRKLYCRGCMTRNLWSGEQRDFVCLNCARRIVSPRQKASKYTRLREHLWRRGQFTSLVTLKFSAIEGIIDDDLPLGALRNSEWWNNSENSTQGYAWTSAGWNVQSLDLNGRTVTFRKVIQDTHRPSRKRRKAAPQKPFTTVPEKPLKIRVPSKTHVARALARARNVERKMATTTYGGRFKPRRAYEKRLFKPDAKPSSNE